MEPYHLALAFLGSVAAGSLGAVTGVGGGILIVPLLNQVLGVGIKQAIGTSLASVIATSSIGSSVYLRKSITNIRLALFLEPTAILGSIAGAMLVGVLEPVLLKRAFGVTLLYACITMVRGGKVVEANEIPESEYGRSRLDGRYLDEHLNRVVCYRPVRRLAGALLNAIAGLVSGMLGLGGGVVKVPVMNLVMKVPIKAASATSNFMIGFTAASGTLVHQLRGYVLPVDVAVVVAGIYIGSYYGARYMMRLDPRKVRFLFSAILFVTALRMLLA